MNTIAPAIKRRRVQMGLTQKEMADRVHLSEKAWRNIENGATRLDLDRLNEIAELLEMSVTDLINAQETLLINPSSYDTSTQNNDFHLEGNISNGERELFNKMIADKDEQIRLLREENAALKGKVDAFVEKVLKG